MWDGVGRFARHHGVLVFVWLVNSGGVSARVLALLRSSCLRSPRPPVLHLCAGSVCAAAHECLLRAFLPLVLFGVRLVRSFVRLSFDLG